MNPFHVHSAGIPLGLFDLPEASDTNAADPPESCLLDIRSFFTKETNATMARYRTTDPDDGHHAMDKLGLVWSTDIYFSEDSLVVATHGGLVLLGIALHMMRGRFPK